MNTFLVFTNEDYVAVVACFILYLQLVVSVISYQSDKLCFTVLCSVTFVYYFCHLFYVVFI